MRFPQIVVYERDGRLAELLRPMALEQRWKLRQPRRSESCLRLLQLSGPTVCLLRVGPDVVREMALLDQVAWHCPQAVVFVVMDVDYPAVDSLALELGAFYVHRPQASRGELPALVIQAMNSLLDSQENSRKPGRKKALLASEESRDASSA